MVRADPDGVLRDVEHAHTHRGLRLWKNRGRAGWSTLRPTWTRRPAKLARVVLDAWSKPVPAADATPDLPDGAPCPPGRPPHPDERMHDAFGDVLKVVLNSGDLPACGGTPAAMVWHITDDQLRDRYGLAVSEHGTLLPVADALRVCDQTHLYVLIENSEGRPALPRPHHPDRHPRPDHRPGRPRPRLLLPRLRPPTQPLPTTPHQRLAPPTDPPTSTTSPCSAATTTANTPNAAGSASCETGYRTGDHPPGSTHTDTPIRNTRHLTLPDTG